MEPNKTFRIMVIVTTLVTIFTPVQSNGSLAARSLISVSPSSDPPSASESPSPANSPTEIHIDSPAASPAESLSPTNPPPTETDIDSPAASPAESISPSNPPTETQLHSPAPSPADSVSPTNPPAGENLVGPSSSGKTLKSSATNILSQPLLSAEPLLSPGPLLSPEIKTICAKTDSPQLCESSVASLLTAQIKPDTSSVLVLAIQASINATKAAMSIVDKVAASDCQELYDDAMANLEDAITAVESRDIATVNTNLSAAMTDYSTCNDGFEESGEPNPLADVSDKLTKMVSNCLAISTLIK